MLIRKSRLSDQETIAALIRETVQTVNLGDYSKEQVLIWSGVISPEMLKERWDAVIQYVAEHDGTITGVGDIRPDKEEVDFLYVHKDHIGEGIGSALLDALEKDARNLNMKKLLVTSSITAKPFFESKGFTVVRKFIKTTNGHDFIVFSMIKALD